MNSNEKCLLAPMEPRNTRLDDNRNGCPLCGSVYSDRVFKLKTWARYTIERCRDCDFVHAAPRPAPEDLERFYTSGYFRRNEETGLGYADYRSMAELNARRMWHDLRSYMPSHETGSRRLLDVGCATGGFMSEAQADGWNCTGVELSEYAVSVARNEFHLNVMQGDIFLDALQGNLFSLITMWHVLEHVIDPVRTLKRAYSLLEPGGMLFVELPNWGSLGRRIRGKHWGQLKPPEHINYFTPETLSRAALETGFRVSRISSEYPSLVNEAAVRRWSRPLHQGRAMIASLACKFGGGGYARLLAERV